MIKIVKTRFCSGCKETVLTRDFRSSSARKCRLCERDKPCSSCGKVLPPSMFYRDKTFRNNRHPQCKTCKKKNTCKERVSAYARWYIKNNKDKVSHLANLRRARKLQATPQWLTPEHKECIRKYYTFRANISGVIGKEYHVDHIVPLKGENVCGLHVPWNLQVIPAQDNIRKSNLYNDWR